MVVREDMITEYEREWMGGGMYGTEHALNMDRNIFFEV